MKIQYTQLIGVLYGFSVICGCDSDEKDTEKEASGTPAGQTALMSGEMAGQPAGGTEVNGGMMGGMMGGHMMMDYGRINPNQPLPTPSPTTLPVPDSIAMPHDGQPNPDCSGSWVEEARGWVVDEVGRALEGAKVQLCARIAESGALVCLMPADSVADGSFKVTVPEDARCMSGATFRSLVPQEKFASIYCHANVLEVSEDGVLRVQDPLVLYETRPAVSLEEAGGEATLTYANEISLTVNPEALYGPSPATLWGRALSADVPGLCFLDDTVQVDQLFTFSPEGDITDETGAIKLPNDKNYEPMTELALYALGNLDCSVVGQDEGVEEGEWARVGTATVDASGAWIEASGSNGLPCVSWFGYGPIP